MSTSLLCTFVVDDLHMAASIADVEEVSRAHQMTPVPLAPSAVRGLINLRGRIVTAIDMRERLLLPPRNAGAEVFSVVVSTRDSTVSLLVDEIGDVIEVPKSQFEAPPETLRPSTRELIRGVYKLDRRLMLVLDLERTVAFKDR